MDNPSTWNGLYVKQKPPEGGMGILLDGNRETILKYFVRHLLPV